ncbi:MAG: metal-dependent hydrolase [Candidatus Bathyarchaeia archaeon]
MKLLTHTAFGMFVGTILFYFLDMDIGFVLLCGFAAFIPDVDWRMQYSWHFGNVHRKLLHNVWVMCILAVATYMLFQSLILVFGIIVGFMSHLAVDSFTVRGVYWFYPMGKDSEKYHLKGSFSMSEMKANKIEEILQALFFALAGFLFLIKYVTLENIFSFEGIITIAILFGVGFYLYQTLGKTIKRIIRRLGL